MARAVGAARPRAVSAVVSNDDVHMLKTVTSNPKPEVTTLCGEVGRPYGFDRVGLHTTVWAPNVTCPTCRALPGVSGPVDIPPSGGTS